MKYFTVMQISQLKLSFVVSMRAIEKKKVDKSISSVSRHMEKIFKVK